MPNGDLLYREYPESERLIRLADRRTLDMCRFYLSKSLAEEHLEKTVPVQKGDIVIYKLPELPNPSGLAHVARVPKWAPKFSLPHRVIEIGRSSCHLQPLWSASVHGKELIIRPRAEVKVVASRIPSPLRQLVEKLVVPVNREPNLQTINTVTTPDASRSALKRPRVSSSGLAAETTITEDYHS